MATEGDDVDELEALLDSYTADAEKQIRRLEARAGRYAKPRKEKAVREAGLSQPLDEGNKGYILLQKMGYERGKGLGSASTGRAEPLPLNLKTGRAGLGVDEQRKRERQQRQQQEELDRLKRARMVLEAQQRFQDTARADYIARQVLRHLRGAWRVAEQLDEQLTELKNLTTSAGAAGDGARANGAFVAGLSASRPVHTNEQYSAATNVQRVGMGRSEVLRALLSQLPAVGAMLAEEVDPEEVPTRELDGGSVLGEQVRDGLEGEEQREDEGAGARPGRDYCGVAGGCVATGAATEGASSGDTGGGENSKDGRGGVCGMGKKTPAAARCGPDVEILTGEEEAVGMEGRGRLRTSSNMGRGEGGDAGRQVRAGGAVSTRATEPSLSEQLETLLQHLRERHCYCYFCGCQYDTPDDLASSCPGLNEDAH
ncbi:hypothetical protein Vretifemale_18675 [Volvox reticuliferus]|uniref:G-patch domain-containing protein n=1 Tax=Volvox reticuliferus TaxID=1737510 RepID=A0A8J4D1C0_9CHLO|nr:hypothetical protein Vretifemale_18675 [Volvox reticuliferus]